MQGHLHRQHHLQQQQLAALISAALPQVGSDDLTASTPSPEGSKGDEPARLAALDSLHRTIIYPPNALLVSHSAPFLSQGLSQLLSDKSFAVRRAAAVAYGSLCAVATLHGHQSQVITNGLADRFVTWALPLLRDIGMGNGSAGLALESLLEFLNTGDAGSIGRHVPPILEACQELLEDERTSLSLLHPLLGILILISLKFAHCFLPHFVDIVDLLLGWALMPDLSQSDRHIICDAFLKFQDHWLTNLNFSLGLLSKFLGDMELLIHDEKLGRLLALFSCLSTVLQVVASVRLEMHHLLEQVTGPVEDMVPCFLRCIAMFGDRFGWSTWLEECWRCLILLAEILHDKFSNHYRTVIDILFQSLRGVPSSMLNVLLKSNLQLLSLQKQGLLASSVHALLLHQSPLSQLRLHPNHLVVGSAAATYLYLLQHVSDGVVSQAICSLVQELELLRGMLSKIQSENPTKLNGHVVDVVTDNLDAGLNSGVISSDMELLSLIRFDLKLLLVPFSVGLPDSSHPNRGKGETASDQRHFEPSQYERSWRLTSWILEKFDPFEFPISCFLELQTHVIRTLHKLYEIEVLSKLAVSMTSLEKSSGNLEEEAQKGFEGKDGHTKLVSEYLRKYNAILVKALHVASPITVKLEAFNWIHTFSCLVVKIKKGTNKMAILNEPYGGETIGCDLLISVLDCAYHRELKVRSYAASILEILLQAALIYPGNVYNISEVALDKLGDPNSSVKDAYVRVLSVSLPLTTYVYGRTEIGCGSFYHQCNRMGKKHHLYWKQCLAFELLPHKLHSQQLVSVLSYISQRWNMPLSSWIQRLVISCHAKNYSSSNQLEDKDVKVINIWQDAYSDLPLLKRSCSVNNLAAVWWSVHEAARHCVTLRLRTNLGGPTQTFAALERMLLDMPKVLLIDTEQTEGNSLSSSNSHLLPMWLLLDFVEALKKNVYNAYEGSSVMPCPTHQSSLFFRANKKVCEEWFSRMHDPMMYAAVALNCHDATFQYCITRLQDLRNQAASAMKDKPHGAPAAEHILNSQSRLARDVFKVLRHAALALCRSHEPEALAGLQKWIVMAFPSLFMGETQMSQEGNGGDGLFSWMTGIIYQAQGQYETAAAHFSHLLQSEDALSSMGAEGIQFVIARVIECFSSLSDWRSLNNWLGELQTLRAAHAGKAYSGALTTAGNELNGIHALACFDEGDVQAAKCYLDLTPKSSNVVSLDPRVALERSEQMLLQSMLQRDEKLVVLEQLEKARLMLDEQLFVAPFIGLAEAAGCGAQIHCIFAFESYYKCYDQVAAIQLPPLVDSLHQSLQSPISMINQDCSLWMKIFRVYRTLLPTSLTTLLLCWRLHNLARKQSNFRLADRMSVFFRDHLVTSSAGKDSEVLALNFKYDSILLKYAEGKHEEALVSLWSFVRDDMLSSTARALETGNSVKAKACLKLSTWLRQDYLGENLRTVLVKLLEDFIKSNTNDDSLFTRASFTCTEFNLYAEPNLNVILEEIVGTAIKLSCHLCPSMSKAWLAYASWCFAQASGSPPASGACLQTCTLSSALQPEISINRFQLTEEEISHIREIIKNMFKTSKDEKAVKDLDNNQFDCTTNSENEALMNSLVQQAAGLLQSASGTPGFETSDVDCTIAALSSELRTLFLGVGIEDGGDNLSSINKLVNIWWSLRQRRVSLFGHAARGYFQYLSSCKLQEIYCVTSHVDISKEKSKKSCMLRAMLYILSILQNYGVELSETFQRGFAMVPLLLWQEITPQLFARLSTHPKQAIRKQLEGLLLMLVKLSPSSVVYPAAVDKNTCEGEYLEELRRLFDCLYKLHPKLVQDVQLVINELEMITVLWEELWLSTLQDLHSDVIRRINLLKEEAARIAGNSTLSRDEKSKINAAKYSALMAPVVVALERRMASTSREPETAHEKWFQKEFGEQLKSAIMAFKTPPGSAAALGDVWRPFDSIAAALASYQRKTCISLSEVAPHLGLLSSSNVPMPGLEKQKSILHSSQSCSNGTQGIITISSFSEKLTILSTKTKPKKLVLRGSDGQDYTYLLKGREDLRLDARIMQLLQAINDLLHSYTDTLSRSLAIRYYTVTPLSGRAGLIQWVDNVTSIYSVFKSWQNRVQLAQLYASAAGNTKDRVPPVPRPTDMFYAKIIPALKEQGLRRVISRRDWPHEVKRKVLLELMQETPRQLLWQEMWCASEGFKAFHWKAKRFSGSVAAMSMLGHIMGLGDRHLDNILLDFSSGDAVHIDYNVCFDKGKRLKIPEIVPFRLTQTIEAALGFTGIEGIFRANCESVTGVLRKNKDIILMLLEVFVWDPLVEWAREGRHDEAVIGGEEKRGMELAVSLSLFASRIQEMRVPLQEHHDLLLATLPVAESALKRFLDMLNQYEVIASIYYHVDKERANLLQREIAAKSIAAESNSVIEKTQSSFELQAHEFAQAKAVAAEKAKEAAIWVDQHERVLNALWSGSIPDVQAFVTSASSEEITCLTSAVLGSAVPLTVVPEPTQTQCFEIDREVSCLLAELRTGICCAMEALNVYALALQRVFPMNYSITTPVNGWAQILQVSVSNLSSDTLRLAKGQAAELVVKSKADGYDSIQQRHQDLFQKMEGYAMEIKKINIECSELMSSIGIDSETKSKEQLLSAFTKYMYSAGYLKNEGDKSITGPGENKHETNKCYRVHGDIEDKKTDVLFVVRIAANELYMDVKGKLFNFLNDSSANVRWVPGDGSTHHDYITFREFEEQIEKSVLVASFVNEVQEMVGLDVTAEDLEILSEGNWASPFQSCLYLCKNLIEQIAELILPDIIKSFFSHNSEVMEAFGSLSQIRGSIDTTLEQLIEVELEKANLVELEKNYFLKVGLITEQQLALEEAAVTGRDHLSWEEAEELASQEEACRAKLDQLHQTWNEKDMRNISLTKMEANLKNSLISIERYFSMLTSSEQDGDLPIRGSRFLLAALVKPFSELESVDQLLSSYGSPLLDSSSCHVGGIMTSGTLLSQSAWRFGSSLRNHSFFIWKVGILDSILDLCIHNMSSSIDTSLGLDQLYNVLRNKLEIHLENHISHYLKERLAPALMFQLDKLNENLQQVIVAEKETGSKQDIRTVKTVQSMLEEFCTAHETARAAKSAIFLMKKQVHEISKALHKTVLEIIQIEWLHDVSLPRLLRTEVLPQSMLADDSFSLVIFSLNRPKLLEKMKSSISALARLTERLQSSERASVSVEVQLQRAMGWACAGPSSAGSGYASVKSSGIPSEFHEHLSRRKQFLRGIQDKVSDVIKICTSVVEFEASRDGIFHIPTEKSAVQTNSDGRSWQQSYLNILTRLDVAYHSFTRAEQELKLAQNNTEAAASNLFSATKDLTVASVKANSALGDLQHTLATMHECAHEASVALSAFTRVSRGHSALTSDCGPMLEEVLAITENLHDLYSLGTEAAAAHSALMADLTKANVVLLPLEASLSTDLPAFAEARMKEKRSNPDIFPVHGQALYTSYCFRLREACQSLEHLVPSLSYVVKELHSMLTKLARAASLHAGNLHKAFEVVESQFVRSQDLALSRSEFSPGIDLFNNERSIFPVNDGRKSWDFASAGGFSFPDEGWISPPKHTYSGTFELSNTSTDASLPEYSGRKEQLHHNASQGDNFMHASFINAGGQESSCAAKLKPHFVGEDDAISSAARLPPDLSERMHALSVASETTLTDSTSSVTGTPGYPSKSIQLLSPLDEGLVPKIDCSLNMQEKAKDEKSFLSENRLCPSKQGKGYGDGHDDPSRTHSSNHANKGKNAYALSVLRQVELKLEGKENNESRSKTIAEQVDYLLKQATSVDNLCNMYEGWTPWI